MKLRYIKINWLSRTTQTDGRLNTIATQQRFTRCFNEGSVAARTPLPAPVQNETATAPLFDLHERRHNYLRISLTERCNLRCQYCMPAEGVPLSARAALLTRAELTRLVATFARLGVDKLRLTGGEPTLRPDLADIIQELSSIRGIASVGITTNGLVLTRRLPALQRAGLTHLNVSLDSLQKDKYEAMSRRPGLARVLAGIDLALQLGYRPVKINVVLMKGFNDDEIGDFVEYTRDREVEVRFIEFMPFTGNRWDVSRLVPYRTALRAAAAAGHDLRPEPPRQNDTAKVWRAAGHSGTAGFITSMTEHFCGTCNRLRLTADGNLKVCLFGSAEVSLRDAIRGGATEPELEALVRAALRNKKPQHAAAVCDGIKRGRVSATHRPLTRSPFARHAGLGRLREPAHDPHRRVVRAFSSRAKGDAAGALSHLDAAGQARMVDVGDKAVTRREAIAQCHVEVNARLVRLLRDARLPKGDALCVARVAGTLAAKRTADLIPLCHPLPIESVQVSIDLPRGDCDRGGEVKITCAIRVTARTGAEMEALTGCSVAALTLYDMCKSVDRAMRITGLRVVHKSGGKSDVPREPPPPLREPSRDPLDAPETFAPTNFMNF